MKHQILPRIRNDAWYFYALSPYSYLAAISYLYAWPSQKRISVLVCSHLAHFITSMNRIEESLNLCR